MEFAQLLVLLACVAALPLLLGPYLLLRGFWRAVRAPSIRDRGGKPKAPWAMLLAGGVITTLDVLVIRFLSSLDMNMSKGRLLRIDGRARLPRRKLGESWTPELEPELDGLSSWQRAGLTELWLQSARMEQASVPAFAMLSLKLSALGAPLELSERAFHAALDEVDHARRCYALAHSYSGLNWTAGSIPELLSGAPRAATELDVAASLARLATAALRDGCLAEGVAARVAAAGAELTEDAAVKHTLQTIARDERVHSELGWDVVRWCLNEGGSQVRSALASAIAALPQRLAPRVPHVPGLSEPFLREHGLPPQDNLERLAQEELRAVQLRANELLLTEGTTRGTQGRERGAQWPETQSIDTRPA